MPETSNRLDDVGIPLAEEPVVSEATLYGCRNGDPADQRTLYELVLPKVYRLAARMVGQQDAEDLTQQSFLQVFRKISVFRGESQFDTWLYRLVVNECLQHLRRRKSNFSSLEFEPMDHRSNPEEGSEFREMLDAALAKLDPDLRTAIVLREVEKLPYSEIAKVLSIPEGTVASRLSKARSLLKQHLIDLGWEP